MNWLQTEFLLFKRRLFALFQSIKKIMLNALKRYGYCISRAYQNLSWMFQFRFKPYIIYGYIQKNRSPKFFLSISEFFWNLDSFVKTLVALVWVFDHVVIVDTASSDSVALISGRVPINLKFSSTGNSITVALYKLWSSKNNMLIMGRNHFNLVYQLLLPDVNRD